MKITKTLSYIFLLLIFSFVVSAEISATDLNLRGFVGDNVTGTITITNNGATDVNNIVITNNGFANFDLTTVTAADSTIVAGGSTTYAFRVTIPNSEATNLDVHNIGTFTINGTGINETTSQITLQIYPRVEITKVKIDVEGDTETVSSGEKIKVKRGDSISLEIKVDNQFPSSSYIDFNDLDVTVHNTEFDIDENDEIDINSGDYEKTTLNFEIDTDADERTEDVEIVVEGYDDNGIFHKDIFTFEIEVDVPSREVTIKDVSFSPSIISCTKDSILSVEIENTGSRDLDDAMIIIESDDLEFNYSRYIKNIELDEGDSYDAKIKINFPNDLLVGNYLLNVKAYYDGSTSHKTDSNIANIEIINCVNTSKINGEDNGNGDTNDDSSYGDSMVINTQTGITLPSNAVFATPSKEQSVLSLSGNQGLTLLILINIILIIIVVGVIFAITKKR